MSKLITVFSAAHAIWFFGLLRRDRGHYPGAFQPGHSRHCVTGSLELRVFFLQPGAVVHQGATSTG